MLYLYLLMYVPFGIVSGLFCYERAQKNHYPLAPFWAFSGFILPFIPLYFIRSTQKVVQG